MSKYAAKHIQKMAGYTPGEQPKPGAKIVKLNTNENPYPPSPNVRAALGSISSSRQLRKYPEPLADTFRDAAAEVFNVDREMIIAGNGSDDILNIAIRTFVPSGEQIAYPVPTYSLYPTLARLQQAEVIAVPFDPDFTLPVKALAASKAKLTIIANPNAPTGTLTDPQVIDDLAKRSSSVVLIDEAYVDFADCDCLDLVKRHENVIVSRTLSKSYSLAGLRFGFAIAQKPLIDDMMKAKDSYNCDVVAITLATAAIKDQGYLAATVGRIRRQRAYLIAELRKLGFNVISSQANFVWATIRSRLAGRIYLQLKKKGILVRYFDQPGLRDGLRISVGLPKENRAVIDELKRILDQPKRRTAR